MSLKAVWGLDYDWRKDKCFKRPMCPVCDAPFGKIADDNEYHCFSCGRIIEVDDPDMKKWIADREGTKTEMHDCFPESIETEDGEVIKMGCGGKGCMKIYYHKNPVTLKWEEMGGKCEKCGVEFMV